MEARNNMLKTQNENLINNMGTKNGAPLVESSKNVKNAETNILFSHGAIISNKKLIASLGNDATLLLGEIYSEHLYFKGKGETEGGWFFSTVRNLQKNTGLSYYKQNKAIKKLICMGFLMSDRKGYCGMRHFKVNEELIKKYINDREQKKQNKESNDCSVLKSGFENIQKPVFEKFKILYNKNKTNKNNKNISKKETHAREENFEVKNLGKEIEKIKELEEINEGLRESNKKLKETNKELRKELRELREYDKSMEKFLNKLDKLEQEEEIKKSPVDSYDADTTTYSSYSEKIGTIDSKIPGGGRSGNPDHNFKSCRPSFNQLIEEYTGNTELQYELKQHLKVRKIKGALCNHSIELGFKTLDKYAKTDMEKILIVRNANEGGWAKFYELPKWQKPREHADREVSYDIDKYANTYI